MGDRPLKVVVCGSRSFVSFEAIEERLARLAPNTIIIEGGADGADTAANYRARKLGLHVATVKANWQHHGKKAGPLRNQAMLDIGPDLVIAFRSSGSSPGTDHMVRIARAAGVPVELYLEGLGWQEEADRG